MQLSFTDIVQVIKARPPPVPSTWTDERTALLKSSRAQGRSAKQIADELGGVSRCAVIGKCYRLGLAAPVKKPRPAPTFSRAQRAERQAAAREQHNERKRLENGSLSPLIIVETPVPADFLNLTFDDLLPFRTTAKNQCRYIRGENADMRFCGQPTPRGEPYCRACAAITYRTAT